MRLDVGHFLSCLTPIVDLYVQSPQRNATQRVWGFRGRRAFVAAISSYRNCIHHAWRARVPSRIYVPVASWSGMFENI